MSDLLAGGGAHSRLAQLMNAKTRLPPQLQVLFRVLFEDGLTEEQACQRLHIDAATLERNRSMMLRSLKAASV